MNNIDVLNKYNSWDHNNTADLPNYHNTAMVIFGPWTHNI